MYGFSDVDLENRHIRKHTLHAPTKRCNVHPLTDGRSKIILMMNQNGARTDAHGDVCCQAIDVRMSLQWNQKQIDRPRRQRFELGSRGPARADMEHRMTLGLDQVTQRSSGGPTHEGPKAQQTPHTRSPERCEYKR